MWRALIIAVLVGIIGGQLLLDVMFPLPAAATEGFNAKTWKPCPSRKPERVHGRRAVWYCGPSDAQSTLESSADMDSSATARSPEKRTDSSRTHAARGHR